MTSHLSAAGNRQWDWNTIKSLSQWIVLSTGSLLPRHGQPMRMSFQSLTKRRMKPWGPPLSLLPGWNQVNRPPPAPAPTWHPRWHPTWHPTWHNAQHEPKELYVLRSLKQASPPSQLFTLGIHSIGVRTILMVLCTEHQTVVRYYTIKQCISNSVLQISNSFTSRKQYHRHCVTKLNQRSGYHNKKSFQL